MPRAAQDASKPVPRSSKLDQPARLATSEDDEAEAGAGHRSKSHKHEKRHNRDRSRSPDAHKAVVGVTMMHSLAKYIQPVEGERWRWDFKPDAKNLDFMRCASLVLHNAAA